MTVLRTPLVTSVTVACMAVWSAQTAQAQQQITDRWSRMADMSSPHEYHVAVEVDGEIYVVGGNTYLSRESAVFEAFEPETNTRKSNHDPNSEEWMQWGGN